MRSQNILLYTVFVAAVCFFAPGKAAATIYSYVDANGTVHFSNVPHDPRYKPVKRNRPRVSATLRDRQVYIPARTPDLQPASGSYEPYIREAAMLYQVDPRLVKAIIKAESNFDYLAVSRKGAQGLMQLMPQTAREMNVLDPFNPQDNINGGTKYFRKMLELFDGNLKLALAAYNAGPTRVIRLGNRVPRFPETLRYIKRVMSHYNSFKEQSSPSKKWAKVAYNDTL